jgi:GT2 family glycosyltransferase
MTERGLEIPGTFQPDDVAAVIIGRNEGARLGRCLDSVLGSTRTVVYVDSGSTDGSVALATGKGARVVAIDLRKPFTAARARNAGFEALMSEPEPAAYVQFVDGDCEVDPDWMAVARAFLAEHPETAVVFGRRRERYPERSAYNRLCDLEWAVPAGETRSCGGDAMIRAASLAEVGGYRADLIAGEEPELCVRLRGKGWRIVSLDRPMTLHDAAITRFGQWWRRTLRAGYAFAQGAYLHGSPPERHWVAETRRALVWGAAIPLAVLLSALVFGAPVLLLLLVYPAQVVRLYLKRRGTMPIPLAASVLHVLGRFPEALGALRFAADLVTGRAARLIEYK